MADEDLLATFDRLAGQLEPEALTAAQRRRGALMFAASLGFDHILDDLVVSDVDREQIALPRYVDEHLPSRMRRHYDAPFLRKLLATTAKVAQDLASDAYTHPACTAEELMLWLVLQQWQMLLDLTDLGPSWTDLSEYLFEDLDFEYLFDADMDGIEDDPLAHKTSGIEVRGLDDWFAPFNTDSRVHPYALDLNERDQPVLYDLTGSAEHGEHFTRTVALTQIPITVTGLEPVSDIVAAARQDARTHRTDDQWIPDERDPARSLPRSRPARSSAAS